MPTSEIHKMAYINLAYMFMLSINGHTTGTGLTTPFDSSSSSSRPDASTNLRSTSTIAIFTTVYNISSYGPESSSGLTSTRTLETSSFLTTTQIQEISFGPSSTQTPEISSGTTPTQTPEISSGSTSTQTPEISLGATATQTLEISPGPTSSQTPEISPSPTPTQSPEISSGPTSKPSTSPTDNGIQQDANDKDAVIIVLALILSLSLVLVIVLGVLYRKGKLKCIKQPDNPCAENPRTITHVEPGTNYSNLSDVSRNNTDNTYQELQNRNSNSPYTNLPYSSSSEIETGTNYSSLSDGNKLDTDNHGYQELQTRTPTSPYSNLPYTSEHNTYANLSL
ncbi:uncharacterized protein LOC126816203 [Patella vulgata]|uniref:uncharacterized protein LOC126816203 n=1 Tax=Patella vulgata TaxID=6465 RepID=UPI00217FC574|nr:uncharacterized protein LOC126816203 [Patella vulgata]